MTSKATTLRHPKPRLASTLRLIVGVALISSLAGLTVACESPDWTSTEYIKKQLIEGDRLKALEETVRLPTEKQKELVPTLVDLYKGDKDKEKAYKILVELRDEKAKEVYVDAMKNAPSNRDKASAAIALGDIKAKDQIPGMLQAFQTVPNENLRRSILASFDAMPDASQLPLLTDILTKYDPDREPIAYHAYACEIITKIGQFSESTVDALVYGMYLDNAKGQNVYKECATAVLAAGELATPAMIKVIKGENKAIITRFSKYPSYVEGVIEVKAADVLGMLHDPAVVEPLLAELKRVRNAPPQYRDDKLLGFAQNRIQLFVFGSSALGDVGDPKALEFLKAAGQLDKEAIAPYQAMLDYDKRAKHDIVQGAVAAINKLGDRSALPYLAEVAEKGDIPELAKYGNKAFAYQTRWEAGLEYARLADGGQLETFDKLIAAEKEKDVKEKFGEYRKMIEVAKQCDKQAACYERHLLGKDKTKADKAAWELGRLDKGGAAEDVLAKGLSLEAIPLRLVVIHSLYRVGTKKSVEAIDKVLKAEENRRTPEFKDLHFKMRALKSFLKRQKA